MPKRVLTKQRTQFRENLKPAIEGAINSMKIFNKYIRELLKLRIKRVDEFDPPQMPAEASNEERQLIEECGKFSMTGPVRMWALVQAMKHVQRHGIQGDFVECGVWKGGNLALLDKFSKMIGLERKVYGFDTFSGMPEPDNVDIDLFGNSAKETMQNEVKDETVSNIHAFATIEQVRNNLKNLNIRDVNLIQGNVEDTLAKHQNIPDQIAILRLDTDWYSSTKVELKTLYPLLQSGGVLIIDDYGHYEGAKKAVDEYFNSNSLWMHYVDYTCRLIIKP